MTRANISEGTVRIGCSGWVYPHWKGVFYPADLPQKDRLAYYAARFDTVELNGSFYRLPSEAAVAAWAEHVPEGFVFAWKVSRYITQAKKLKDPAEPLTLVFGRMAPLGHTLGPALFQLPPRFGLNLERLATFLDLLPKGPRVAIEFRDASWYVDEVFALLQTHDVALCLSDHHDAPAPRRVTASWVYVRGHGPGGRYVGRYPSDELARLAERIGAWRGEGRDVYAYFDNDIGGAAPVDAQDLTMRLSAEAGR